MSFEIFFLAGRVDVYYFTDYGILNNSTNDSTLKQMNRQCAKLFIYVFFQYLKSIDSKKQKPIGQYYDGDSIPLPQDISIHQANPEYAGMTWATVEVDLDALR